MDKSYIKYDQLREEVIREMIVCGINQQTYVHTVATCLKADKIEV